MSRKGNCWNTLIESLWGSLKVGRLYGVRFETCRQAMDEVIDWLNYYNHRRPHSTLGLISPMKFEYQWFVAQLEKSHNKHVKMYGLPGQGHFYKALLLGSSS